MLALLHIFLCDLSIQSTSNKLSLIAIDVDLDNKHDKIVALSEVDFSARINTLVGIETALRRVKAAVGNNDFLEVCSRVFRNKE